VILGIPNETTTGERRVALVPEALARLLSKGLEVSVEAGAGMGAWFSDEDYRRGGARVEGDAATLLSQADLIAKIRAPNLDQAECLRQGSTLICLLFPRANLQLLKRLAARGINAVALENLPRTTVAQAMDVLSSQSTVAGYRAVIAAANRLPKFFPMLMTPAGTIAPARVLVIGAGVAGLQAIATARRLGAVVEAFDVRPVAREEVESLGARFVSAEIDEDVATAEGYARQLSETARLRARAAIQKALANADVCIATALVPNQRAPILVTAEMVRGMRPGAVIVDLAAEQGGNCELTEAGEEVVKYDVTIIGRLNLAAEVAVDASRMFSRNLEKLLGHFYRDGALRFDFTDEITRRCVVTYGGEILPDELRSLIANDGAGS
jgi:NAD(P) transhydrogenase subunit alpha